MSDSGQTLRRRTNPMIYALGMLGLTIPGQMFSAYSTYFYNDKLGLPLAFISLGTLFYTVWDAFNDPLFGFLSDRTRTRFGRRKPWLLVCAPLFALFYLLFFSPPAGLAPGAGMAVYFTLFLMLTETMSTITSVNYHSLFPEIYRESRERTNANALRQALQLVGMIIGVSLTPMFTEKLGYTYTALFLAGLGMSLLVISTVGSHENPDYATSDTPGFFRSMRAVLKNRNFWTVSATNFFYQATTGMLLLSIPYFVKYGLGLADAQATFLTAAVFVTAIPAMVMWAQLIKRFGSLRMWRAALAVLGLSVIPMYFVSSLVPSMIVGACIGIGIAGVTANIDLINARMIDDDARASGLRREGIYISTINFVIRFSSFARSLILLLVTLLFGFVSGENPGTQAGTASRFMMAVFPAALMLISVLFSALVRFNDRKDANL